MNTTPRFSAEGRGNVHSESRFSQFRISSERLREVIRDLVDHTNLAPGTRLLDYGCANAPYLSLLPNGVEYVGADLPGNPVAAVDLAADGRVPLPDASIDVVLSTQVLEHVEDPVLYLDECFRLLKTGGALIVSTHGIMYYHPDPEDYWRWTRAGLEKVLGERGFHVVEVRGVLALAAAALQIFQDGTIGKLPLRLQRYYAFAMQVAIGVIDRRYEESTRIDNCFTIAMRATKPLAAGR